MLTVIIVRRSLGGGVVTSGLVEYVLSFEDEDGYDQDYRDPEDGFIVASYDERLSWMDDGTPIQRTWDEIAGRLTTMMGSGKHSTYIVDAEGISSMDFVEFIRKVVKPFEARVIDVVVKSGSNKKFEKGLRI